MTSRFPPSINSGDGYLRERSPSRRFDRRSPYNDASLASRITDPSHRPNDSHASRREPMQQPPRGPRALEHGPRGGYLSRGRGYLGRDDGRGRDARDPRDEPSYRRGGRGQDWAIRDRFEPGDRRPSPTGRDRSRSPLSRDFRDARNDPIPWRRDSRDGHLSAGPSVSDAFLVRGRSSYRVRSRGNWELGQRGRNIQPEERNAFAPRSRSRDREWGRNARGWDTELDSSRRDEDPRLKTEREEREREDHVRRDLPPYRPDSRNSGGAPLTPVTSRSTSTASVQQARLLGRYAQNFQDPKDHVLNQNRRSFGSNGVPDISAAASKEFDRGDLASRRVESERFGSRPSSPPQAPPVPAFGSIPQRPTPTTQPSTTNSSIPKDDAQSVHPSRRGLLDPSRDAPSALKDHILSKAPTAPKAQQGTERRPINEKVDYSNRALGDAQDSYGSLRQPTAFPANPNTAKEPVRNLSKRFSQHPAELDSSRISPSFPGSQNTRASDSAQPSVRKAVEEQGHNGNVASSINYAASLRPPADASTSQTSPIKIPTGPRAERGASSIRHHVTPSIRGPIINRTPTMMQSIRGGRQASTKVWINPDLQQQSAGRAPSIMKPVPTKRDFVGDDKSRPNQPSAESTESAIEAWRRNNVPAGDTASNSSAKDSSDLGNLKSISKLNNESTTDLPEGKGGIIQETKTDAMTENTGKGEESDEAAVDDGEMDYDELDFAEAERKFNREMQVLEARRPPTPRSNLVLLESLEELDALASALDEKIDNKDIKKEPINEPAAISLPSPKIEDVDEMNSRGGDGSQMLKINICPQTPPVASLPFLSTGPPTPFSDIEDLQQDDQEREAMKSRIVDMLANHREQEDLYCNRLKQDFAIKYKPWRRSIDELEDERRAEDAMTVSPNPSTIPLAAPTPPMVGRRGKNSSELDIENVIKESAETAAREDRARRERDGPVYTPAEQFDAIREAVIPDMLSSDEACNSMFRDTNTLVDPELALTLLSYIPTRDDFTEEEHELFLAKYLRTPKRFGTIAEVLPGRTYKDCAQHYYLTKKTVRYKDREIAFSKTPKGKKVTAAREAQMRSKSNIMNPSYDGIMEYGARGISLTEKGRPRRAAAPTFGENGYDPATAAPTPVRRNTASKGNMNGDTSSEKPTGKRTRTVPPKEKVGRKGRVPLLPSPQKIEIQGTQDLSKEPQFENEQRMEEVEGPKAFTALPTTQTYSLPAHRPEQTDNWPVAPQPLTDAPLFQKPPQPPLQGLPPSLDQAPAGPSIRGAQTSLPTSYWSVPESQDFRNYIKYFGTDWHAIARTMKTKTHTMIKNLYKREIAKGDDGRALEEAAEDANHRRERGEDMGPVPPQTPIQKRRYDTVSSRESHRTIAPLVDGSESLVESRGVRISKSQTSPPNSNRNPQRLAASVQAEQGAAELSSRMQAQGVASPMNRITIRPQQRTSQQLQGPSKGIFQEQQSRPNPQSHTSIEAIEHQQRQIQQARQQQQQQQQQQIQDQQQQRQILQRQQELEDQSRQVTPLHKTEQAVAQQHASRNQMSNSIRESLGQYPLSTSQPHAASQVQIEFPEESRLAYCQYKEREAQRDAQQQAQQRAQQHAEQVMKQRAQQQTRQHVLLRSSETDSSSTMRSHGSGSYINPQYQGTPTQSPATLILPVPMSPTGAELLRPSSVPVPSSIQQPPPPAPKKSSIMNLLNDEPADPKPSQRINDPRETPAAPTPSPQPPLSSASQSYPASQHMQQQQSQRDAPSESHQCLQQLPQQQHGSFLSQQGQQQPQSLQTREHTSDWLDMGRALHEQRPRPSILQSHSTGSPQKQHNYLPPASRQSFHVPPRHDHGPSPPPQFGHSRTSSHSSIQQQQQAQPRGLEHRMAVPPLIAASSIRPSPYGADSIRPSPYVAESSRQTAHQHHNRDPQQYSQGQQFYSQQQQQQRQQQQAHLQNMPLQQHRHLSTDNSDFVYRTRPEDDISRRLQPYTNGLQQQQNEAVRQQDFQEQLRRERERDRECERDERMLRLEQENERRGSGLGRTYTPFYGPGDNGYAPPGLGRGSGINDERR